MRGGGKEKNWQVDAVDKLSWGGSHLQCSMSKALETEKSCEERVLKSADICPPLMV